MLRLPLLAVIIAALPIATFSAPAPKRKPPVRPPIVGEWRLTWGPGSGPAVFRKDGSYRYAWREAHYSGEYQLEGDTLTLLDGPHDSYVESVEYKILLEPGTLRGKSPGWCDAAFALEPAGK